MNRTKPALVFSPTGRHQGFNAKAMSSVDDLQPTRFVRELLQNSLDAGVEADCEVVHVRFKVTLIHGTEIPDLDGYERVLNAAVQTHGRPAERAREVVNRMRTAIEDGQQGLWCLSILDNGIGLDQRRMTAILADGAPQKDDDALGSFGVGHFAPIATSNLRYALYGGVHMHGRRRIASGMAVIASHRLSDAKRKGSSQADQATLWDGCGQLAVNDDRGKDGTYRALTGDCIPYLVGRELDSIADSWGHGTAVVIPAFNYFNAETDDDSYLHRLVPKVAAYNFHPAIEAGRLVIEVDETSIIENGRLIVDKDGLRRVLEDDQHRVRKFRADGFHAGLRPAGQHAHSAWRTVVEGTNVRIETAAGALTARILVGPPCGGFRVDLFRDGMWITDSLPGMHASDFSDRKPFHAVLLLERGDGGQLLDIINKAEGPDHNSLDLGRLSKKTQEREKLLKLLREIREGIRQNTPEETTDDYTADDFLAVATGSAPDGSGKAEYTFWGAPVVVSRAPTRSSPERKPPDSKVQNKEKRDNRERKPPDREPTGRSTRNVPINATVVPDGPRKHQVAFECPEAVKELELSLVVDENTDATCDRVWPDELVTVEAVEIEVSSDHAESTKTLPPPTVAPDGTVATLSNLVPGIPYLCTVTSSVKQRLSDGSQPSALRLQLCQPNTEGKEASE